MTTNHSTGFGGRSFTSADIPNEIKDDYDNSNSDEFYDLSPSKSNGTTV
jgi:hypothetical protein